MYPQSHVAFHLHWENFFNTVCTYKIDEIKSMHQNAQDLHKDLLEKSDAGKFKQEKQSFLKD